MDSMKAALGLLNSDPSSYNQSDVDNCKEFMKEQTCPEKKFSWLDGEDSLPAGWRYRVSEGDAKMEWFLSPEGRMYRSRYTAVSDMVKNKERVENVEEMKVLMERHEGWERSKLLPAGWLFKVKSEIENDTGVVVLVNGVRIKAGIGFDDGSELSAVVVTVSDVVTAVVFV